MVAGVDGQHVYYRKAVYWKTSCPTNRSIIQMQIHLPFLFLHEDDGHEYMEGQTVWIFSHDHYVPGYPLNASQVYCCFLHFKLKNSYFHLSKHWRTCSRTNLKKKKQLSIMVFSFQKYILEFHRCTCVYIYIMIQTSQRFTTFDSSKLMMEDRFFSSRLSRKSISGDERMQQARLARFQRIKNEEIRHHGQWHYSRSAYFLDHVILEQWPPW